LNRIINMTQPTTAQLLHGKPNSRQWKRDFRIAARDSRVQDIFICVYEAPETPVPSDYGLTDGLHDVAANDNDDIEFTFDMEAEVVDPTLSTSSPFKGELKSKVKKTITKNFRNLPQMKGLPRDVSKERTLADRVSTLKKLGNPSKRPKSAQVIFPADPLCISLRLTNMTKPGSFSTLLWLC
jgi:hypothetical protein